MNFFKTFLASCLGSLVALIALFFILIMLMAGVVAGIMGGSEEQVIVSEKSVLHLDLDVQITEQQAENPFAGLPFPGAEPANVGLLPLKQAIKNAKSDPKIEGIYLNVTYPMTGFATLEEIRQSILDFRESGKWVVAYADAMSEGAYYLASAADKVYLNPEGDVEFNGLAVEVTFFKKMFDKLEIKPEIFRVGQFKSAVEPFMLEKMSPENKLQLTEMINSIYDHVLTRVSEARGMDKSKLKEISDKMLVRNAKLSVEHGLVDSLLYYDQVLDELRGRLGLKDDAKVKFIKYNKYRKSYAESTGVTSNEVAVIVADGTIMMGTGDQGVIGGEAFASEIRRARENDKVKAIVIRINSPGGSFVASDMMWREVNLASQEKPVIASMSDYAASGGYYLAMACDTIVAQPHTITGSIGIFSVLFDASGLLNNKLGITFDDVKTGEYGDMVTISRPLTDAEKNVWQTRTEEIYETFTRKAAEGRHMTQDDIKQVASGRVWTGTQAKEKKLVDVLGGYNDAIEIAAKAAGIDDYKVRLYPRQKPFFQEFMEGIEENARVSAMKEELGSNYIYYQYWQEVKTCNGVQARMPFELVIQ
ncbi:MAG TPA: signal peptide peptidase SppA [Cyclobacteriaceae bacterium]|nr:signal peptide peptidase SppA [Cyclobacteriaceae bacterium]HMV08626.1 signal peptide peptidase SppA [Cyclobacteriaceae bacterium]HMV91355.1 signal peptide peptidase SppA [Cyclobacteriaceae bacterium]HMX00165.1 signal peptide peptidase SppA [Cyclobacteriaceae bacterium]HMX52231.1 signal peptide peptidase SppA [Cyclobacteriaceae bacterium]